MQSTGSPPQKRRVAPLEKYEKNMFFPIPFRVCGVKKKCGVKMWRQQKMWRGEMWRQKVWRQALRSSCKFAFHNEFRARHESANDELPRSSRNPKASPMFENCYNNINKNSPHRCFWSWTSVFLMPRPTLPQNSPGTQEEVCTWSWDCSFEELAPGRSWPQCSWSCPEPGRFYFSVEPRVPGGSFWSEFSRYVFWNIFVERTRCWRWRRTMRTGHPAKLVITGDFVSRNRSRKSTGNK